MQIHIGRYLVYKARINTLYCDRLDLVLDITLLVITFIILWNNFKLPNQKCAYWHKSKVQQNSIFRVVRFLCYFYSKISTSRYLNHNVVHDRKDVPNLKIQWIFELGFFAEKSTVYEFTISPIYKKIVKQIYHFAVFDRPSNYL